MQKYDAIIREIAEERVKILFLLAQKRTLEDTADSRKLSKKYVKTIMGLGRHYRLRLPGSIKNRICKNCNNLLVPGLNCSVRISGGNMKVYKCSCGSVKKVYFKK
jgi:ribonuclease P protein subunit RPR2